MSNRRTIEAEPLNLVPIMNLVTILIPFLLLAMKSFELSVIDTTVPSMSPNNAPPSDIDKPKQLMLKLSISKKGLRILGADEILIDEKAASGTDDDGIFMPCANDTCTNRDSYPWKDARANLLKIKTHEDVWCRPKDTDTIILVPDANIKYAVLVDAMDVTRSDHEIKDLGIEQIESVSTEFDVTLNPEAEEMCKKSSKPVAVARPLFPKVVMAADIKQGG